MFGLRDLAAAAVAALSVAAVASTSAGADGPANPSYLLFAGTDLWRESAFMYGGTLWSPGGLAADGFTGIR